MASFDGTVPTTPSPSERFSSLFWRKKHPTTVYCCVFWSFGMCVAFLGPTLLELGCKTGASFATMGWVFFAQTLFILVGSATGGILTQRFTSNVVLLSATVMLAATLAIIPLCYRVALLACVLAIMGYFMGIIDTVANVSMISLYTKDVSPFLQALHFFYGLGAFVSPMIAEPFLNANCSTKNLRRPPLHSLHLTPALTTPSNPSEPPPAPTDLTLTMEMPTYPFSLSYASSTSPTLGSNASLSTLFDSSFSTTSHASSSSSSTSSHNLQTTDSTIDYLFWIMALLQVPVIIAVSSLLAKQVYKHVTHSDSASTIRQREEYEVMEKGLHLDVGEGNGGNHPLATNSQALIMTLLTAFLLFLYDGLQAAYGGYVYSYAMKTFNNTSPTTAAYLNACFWGTFAFGRLISIPIATRLSPDFMLFCNIVGCCLSMLLMILFRHDHIVLYLGTCIFGIFLSSVYPTAISLAEQYINVTSSLASCIIVGAATGEMILPIIVGHEFDRIGPLSLVVTGLVITLLSFVVYVAIWVTGNSILRRTATPGMLGMLTSFFHKSGPDEDSGLVTHHVKYYSRMRSDISESSLGGELNDGSVEQKATSPANHQ